MHDLCQHVIFRCVNGSRAYGLEHSELDTDRRGVYLPPAQELLGEGRRSVVD